MSLSLGIDFGTSACRMCVIDDHNAIVAFTTTSIPPPQVPQQWWQILCDTLTDLQHQITLHDIKHIAIDGTSATILLCDRQGTPLTPAIMYNDTSATAQASTISQIAPPDCAAHGASSSLAKLLYLQQTTHLPATYHIAHQADWLTAKLTGRFNLSDENNSLKLGYDPQQRQWPTWLNQLYIDTNFLPKVHSPGTFIAPIQPAIAKFLGLSTQTKIISGTTDSTAAVIATKAHKIGDAITSLGSTLVIKVISQTPIYNAEYGIYSHRLGNVWLVGGASNSGGAVLRHHFSQTQLDQMTPYLKPHQPTNLNYYPLVSPGERFPINDPQHPPHITPRPLDDILFFQGLLEGIAHIEQLGYQQLQILGANYPQHIFTMGGGANNQAWQTIRSQLINAKIEPAPQAEAAYGSALLANGQISCYY